jgi:hypothetical protein
LGVSALSSPVLSKGVVDELGTINTNPNPDVLVLEELTPLRIDERAVRLYRMDNVATICRKGLEEFQCITIELHTHNQRFASVPIYR